MTNSSNKFYNTVLTETKETLKDLSKKSKLINWARGIIFIAGIVLSVLAFKNISSSAGIASIVIFLALFLISVKIGINNSGKIKYNKHKLSIAEKEQNALNFDFSVFDDGSEYINPKHDFSFDLDIFGKNSIFQILNRTKTQKGKKALANLLNTPHTNNTEIKNTQLAVSELKNNAEQSIHFQTEASLAAEEENLTENKLDSEQTNFAGTKFSSKIWQIMLIIIPIISLTAIILTTVGFLSEKYFTLYLVAIFSIIAFNLKYINQVHSKTTKLSKVLQRYSILLNHIETQDFQSEKLKELQHKLLINDKKASVLLKEFSKLLNGLDNRLNFLFALVADSTVLWDIQIVRKLEIWQNKYACELEKWIDIIAEYEVLTSLAVFHFNNPNYVFPEISEDFTFEIKKAGHPIINNSKLVKNDFRIEENTRTFIVTGANMAGKSTFLRTIGVNFVLAQIGSVVCADYMILKPLTIRTSIRITDSLASDESYFYAELLRLKSIVNDINSNDTLIIIDEMLRGTNSADKHKGSEGFLRKLINKNVISFLATHDVQLGELEKEFAGNVRNYCFEAEIINDELKFDYKLRKGVSQNLNATYLMKKMDII